VNLHYTRLRSARRFICESERELPVRRNGSAPIAQAFRHLSKGIRRVSLPCSDTSAAKIDRSNSRYIFQVSYLILGAFSLVGARSGAARRERERREEKSQLQIKQGEKGTRSHSL